MINSHQLMENYIEHCEANKRLDKKTLKAYRIDLKQFSEHLPVTVISDITPELIENYIAMLNKKYQPKTVKRKIASIKAFFHFLEYKDILNVNPFNKLQIHFREPVKLPRTIPLHTIEIFLSTIYSYQKNAKTLYQRRNALRDAAVIELLFSSGIRISELCALQPQHINLYDGTILIHGKGNKERIIPLGEYSMYYLNLYMEKRPLLEKNNQCEKLFLNNHGKGITRQGFFKILKNLLEEKHLNVEASPHTLRHSFATHLLEGGADLKSIQEIGHSDISTTRMYTHVTNQKVTHDYNEYHPREKKDKGEF